MYRQQLTERFYNQATFAKSYSPLYHRLFTIVGDWLKNQPHSQVVQWLLEISKDREPLDVTLLLMAGLHREILLDAPDTEQLANLYPSVSPDWDEKAEKWDSEAFSIDTQATNLPNILHRTIQKRQDALTPFIQECTVQTNETGRGIIWLLPTILTGWPKIHLVDLGASAGLNLIADQRAYRVMNASGKKVADLGKAKPVQFTVKSRNKCKFQLKKRPLPNILSRTGCDINPFFLKTYEDEITLTSFIWADQVRRIERLREGIAAFRELGNINTAPVRLYKADLPNELPGFLEKLPIDQDKAPVVLYNTFVLSYLDDKGTAVRNHLSNWAKQQERPILWLQAEPPKKGEPPESEWLAWTADLWQGGAHQQWQLAWTHPHCTAVKWRSEEYEAFVAAFKDK